MKIDVVVDIGNSRMKWGRCDAESVVECAVFSFDAHTSWADQLERWHIDGDSTWAISDVAPERCRSFMTWLKRQGHHAIRIHEAQQLPLTINVEHPQRVGMDRLFDAVAANARRETNQPAIVIDAGSAITVDVVGPSGVFEGGAILPGFRLLTTSLHDHTALLPLVTITETTPKFPAKTTEEAIRSGVFWMVAGGVSTLVENTSEAYGMAPIVFVTGGDGSLLQNTLAIPVVTWPSMTLEGIRLTAESLTEKANGDYVDG